MPSPGEADVGRLGDEDCGVADCAGKRRCWSVGIDERLCCWWLRCSARGSSFVSFLSSHARTHAPWKFSSNSDKGDYNVVMGAPQDHSIRSTTKAITRYEILSIAPAFTFVELCTRYTSLFCTCTCTTSWLRRATARRSFAWQPKEGFEVMTDWAVQTKEAACAYLIQMGEDTFRP